MKAQPLQIDGAVLAYVSSHPDATIADIMHACAVFGRSRSTIASAINRLSGSGRLLQRKSASGAPTLFSVLDPPRPGGANVIPA